MGQCCRRVLNTLVAPNRKGGSGPFFQPGRGGCIKSPGNTRGYGSPSGIPIWDTLPGVDVSQGGTWDLLLTDYVRGGEPMTFAIESGVLPIGITLSPDGSFSGTVTELTGSGSVTFMATNPAGKRESGTLAWTIP